MHPMLNTAIKAARRAGGIINRAAQNIDILTVTQKAANDYVSEVDREAERAIIRVLHETYPSHSILAEESGASGQSDYLWIIDPLDGTTNFLHGFPQYAVSIALSQKGVLTQAVVYDPVRNELFTASRGRGAYLNDHRMRVGKRSRLQGCLLGTGFPFKEFSAIDNYLAMFKDFAQKTSGIRRAGAATLDLAYVAAGRLDAFWEFGLAPWDMAAGSLLITEAGGLVGNFLGNSGYLESGDIVAANPKLFSQMIQALAPHLTGPLRK
jgi:myo-inositol-1(or 4)-monophosphatase